MGKASWSVCAYKCYGKWLPSAFIRQQQRKSSTRFELDLLRSILRSRLAQTTHDFLPTGEQIDGDELDARVLVLEYGRAARDGDNLCPFGRAGLRKRFQQGEAGHAIEQDEVVSRAGPSPVLRTNESRRRTDAPVRAKNKCSAHTCCIAICRERERLLDSHSRPQRARSASFVAASSRATSMPLLRDHVRGGCKARAQKL